MKTDAELQCLESALYKWIRPRDLEARVQNIKRQRFSIVATSGCFDILHAGHVRFLREASMLGTWLFVLVNADESVRRLKGPGRPIVSLSDRMEVLNALEPVGYLVAQEEDTPRIATGDHPTQCLGQGRRLPAQGPPGARCDRKIRGCGANLAV
jgi:D-beta-D-heptose 7-phosphate kinase/D-beta-D-heptose 1-phosphate adenosyltransferase